MKTVIIYYSLSGFTASIAETMAKVLKADLIEIKPVEDLKNGSSLIALLKGGSQVIHKKKPALQEYQFKPENYDLIMIGTPVWAWSFAPPLRTFFAENDLKDKKVALFASHQGGPGKTLKNMLAELPEAILVGERDFLNTKEKKAASLSDAKFWAGALLKENKE